jgi:hypothetical protein
MSMRRVTRDLKPRKLGPKGLGPALVRYAKVVNVDEPTSTCTVELSGDSANPVVCKVAGAYHPQLNDIAILVQNGTDLLAVDRLMDGSPAGGPAQGIIKEARRTSNQTGITTVTDLTGLTISHYVWPNRTYKVRGEVLLESNEVGDIPKLSLTDGSNNLLKQSFWVMQNAGQGTPYSVELSFTGLVSTNTWKLRAQRNSGTSTVIMDASAANPAWLRLEDIGPAITYA